MIGAGSIAPGWSNGKAAAVLYAREGAKVLAVDIRIDAARETKQIIDREGGECAVFEADASDAEQVAALVRHCVERYGRVDILHNNVGIIEPHGLVDTSEESWDRVMAVNAKAMFLTCKACVPHMEAQGGGAIVNISSTASIRYGGYAGAAYSASKAAVNQLTQNTAVQYAAVGIRANCVLPGLMHTPTIDHSMIDAYDREAMIKQRNDAPPMKRMGDAWDVAYAALFLASDEARYITGANLVVDGGLTCKFS